MKKGKVIKVSTFIMLLVLVAMLSGCGANKSVSVDVSGIENSENKNQDVDSSSADYVVSSDGVSDEKIERVDNPDGGWTISEYDETGEEVRQSIYDAEGKLKQVKEYEGAGSERKLMEETYYDAAGKLMRNVVYNTDGSIERTTEYEYNEAGEQDKYVTYEYNIKGLLLKVLEYDSTGELNTTTEYYYNADGSIKSTIESMNKDGGKDKRVDYVYDTDGKLKNTSEYVAGRQVRYTTYKKDGSVAYYDSDIEHDNHGGTKYKTYKADGSIYSEREFNNAGQIVKYISYFYEDHDTNAEIAGYTVDEYNDDGNVVKTEYYGIEPTSELLNPTLSQQKETEHFVFYCTKQDIEVLDILAETLEENHGKITSDLGKVPDDKTKVYVSPNLKAHHNKVGRPDAQDWSVGEGRDGCLYLVSPLNPGPAHTYDDMFPVAVHEYTHVVVKLFNRNQPTYLNEGIASYEAGQGESSGYYIRKDMEAGTLPSLKEIEGWKSYAYMSDYDASRGYAYGGVYINFAVEISGFDAVVLLLEGKQQTEAFGMGMEELNEKWMDFLASYVQ